MERALLSLPARFGGLGIIDPASAASTEYQASLHLTSTLVSVLVQHRSKIDLSHHPKQLSKKELHLQKTHHLRRTAVDLRTHLSPPLRFAMDLAWEKGASSWLTALPLREHNFTLPKAAFRDALCLRYSWPLPWLPSDCVCGHAFTTEHALSCPTGGLPTVRHNEIRDLLASCMAEVCVDVVKEPVLQPLSGEVFQRRSTSTDSGSRLDIRA